MIMDATTKTATKTRAKTPPPHLRFEDMDLRQQIEFLAARGDIRGVVERVASGYISTTTPKRRHALLRQAIRANTVRGVPALIDAAFTAMLEHDLMFLVRAQVLVQADLAQSDQASGRGVGVPSAHAVKELLPRLQRQERHLIGLMDRYAKIRRLLSICGYRDEDDGPIDME